ncbi:MAG: IS3 family transposase [Cellvibrionaceae bacterium]|nr:IS3 family transposase [Cellvibrionaceae bacterium]
MFIWFSEGSGERCMTSGKHNKSFFHSLKVEEVHHQDFQTRAEARAILFDCIEIFYNRQRLHSSIGYPSPVAFEEGVLA